MKIIMFTLFCDDQLDILNCLLKVYLQWSQQTHVQGHHALNDLCEMYKHVIIYVLVRAISVCLFQLTCVNLLICFRIFVEEMEGEKKHTSSEYFGGSLPVVNVEMVVKLDSIQLMVSIICMEQLETICNSMVNVAYQSHTLYTYSQITYITVINIVPLYSSTHDTSKVRIISESSNFFNSRSYVKDQTRSVQRCLLNSLMMI